MELLILIIALLVLGLGLFVARVFDSLGLDVWQQGEDRLAEEDDQP